MALKKLKLSGHLRPKQYEYRDHTADIQLHSWGQNLQEAFEYVGLCMFGYMTNLERVEVDEEKTQEFTVEGHDMNSLLFNYLDELLYRFNTDEIVVCDLRILDFDEKLFKVKVHARGEHFSIKKHLQGTEIKAITYSAMQVLQTATQVDIYVIVDI